MNRRLILRLQGASLMLEAALMLPALCVALFYGDGDASAFLKSIGILAALGFPLWFFAKPETRSFRAREGIVSAALSWVLLSVFGALPFWLSGAIPNALNAIFESTSGFTTTGATVLPSLEGLPHGILFWRSFTLWIGGMGVLLLTLALLPQISDRSSQLIRAESPGPGLSKMVPKISDMAKILYLIYIALTLLQWVVFSLAGLSPYDAIIHAMGIAGTGGFSNHTANAGQFQSVRVEILSAAFMILFSISFTQYYRMLRGGCRDTLRSEELRWFSCILLAGVLLCSITIMPLFGNFWQSLRYGAFHSISVMSTTGYTTQNLNQWPQGAQMVLLLLMFVGGCGGSTAGGLKVVRLALLLKTARREIQRAFRPRKVQVIRFEGKAIDDSILGQTTVYFFLFISIAFVGALILSLENQFNFQANLTTALSSVTNVGIAFGLPGQSVNLAGYGVSSKLTLIFLMILGRLEVFPLLALLHPAIWRK